MAIQDLKEQIARLPEQPQAVAAAVLEFLEAQQPAKP